MEGEHKPDQREGASGHVTSMKRDSASGGAGRTILKGAAVLGIAAVITKLLGTLQKIPLQNLAGDEVFGIYSAIYPLYTMLVYVATAGFPIVVSSFVAEYAAKGHHEEGKRVLRVACIVLLVSGTAGFLLLYGSAPQLAGWIGSSRAEPGIRAISFALLLVPVMSALRGYYQGYGRMEPTAWSQVIEQAVRVAAMVALLFVLLELQAGPATIAAGATFGSVVGAAAGLVVTMTYWLREQRLQGGVKPRAASQLRWRDDMRLARRLAVYAIPVCLGALTTPLLGLVDVFMIPRLLRSSGLDEAQAMYAFGLYNHGQPLVLLVSMIAASMAAAIVPAIAEARHRGDREAVRARAGYALRLTWLLGLPASVGLAMLAEPINVMFFRTSEGTSAMQVLAFTAVLSAVNLVAGSVLQGLGAVRAPALYLLVATLAKLALNAALVPRLGIDGAAWAAVGAFALAAVLALAHSLRAAGVQAPRGRALLLPMLSIGSMALGLAAWTHGAAPLLARLAAAMPPRGIAALVALGGVAGGALLYALALLLLRVITAQDLAHAPPLQRVLPQWLQRRLR
ncbi:polysaccharide biosynthesis protein [Paenibacillus sp. YYML68]|uniref:putative polysaccharide biosynthesis protein n=1 Tax=Paenibacillus sp. YYML68 TaxID=2909250 RepID=UPI002493170B|nr:polysaccharide biosynthesis protein [Paenibacillus sp. YYML68]